MLKEGLKVPIPQGHLQYIIKARDKFIAHPMFGGRVRNAHGRMSVPQHGLLHPHATCTDETDPVLLDYYGSSFAPSSAADKAHFRCENEKLISSSKKNHQFSTDEKLRLKAFGIREPSLEANLQEIASLLVRSALHKLSALPHNQSRPRASSVRDGPG
jgi:hypothetical protein